MKLITILAIILYTTTFAPAQIIKVYLEDNIYEPAFDSSTRLVYYDRRGLSNKVYITQQGKFYIEKRRRKYIATDKLIKNILGRIR